MSLFHLKIHEMHWINGDTDDPEDLCLHGYVTAHIGTAVLEYDCALNAAGIYLLRTLSQDHLPAPGNSAYEPLLPCCGHELFAAENAPDSVVIFGCGQGVTWEVRHNGNEVTLTTEGHSPVTLPLEDYRREVFCFCDAIESFYNACAEKRPQPYEIDGYRALWNEWHRRRNA